MRDGSGIALPKLKGALSCQRAMVVLVISSAHSAIFYPKVVIISTFAAARSTCVYDSSDDGLREARLHNAAHSAVKSPKNHGSRGLAARLQTSKCVCPPGRERRAWMGYIDDAQKQEEISREIASLSQLSRPNLKQRWRDLYGTEPPLKISRNLMLRAVAYRIQERAFGGIKPLTRRLLEQIANELDGRRQRGGAPRATVPAGTVLLREWQGRSHHVTVLDEGVLYQRKRYRSLSEVAQVITGARWSGPLFFGLKRRGEEKADAAL